VESKADRKRAKAAAAIFGGISGTQKDSSDSDEENSNSDATPTKTQPAPVQQHPPQAQNVMDLIDLGGPTAPVTTAPARQEPANLLGDIFGATQPSQPATAFIQGPTYRPCSITTPQFGAIWGTLPIEKSVTVVSGITTTEAYKQVVHARLGFQVVETINNEVICAALDASGNQVLVHCRVDSSGSLLFTIKTAQPTIVADLENRLLPSLAGA